MSKLVAFAAIQGGYKVVSQAEGEYTEALQSYNADSKIEFPNTGYYMPIIYSMTGRAVAFIPTASPAIILVPCPVSEALAMYLTGKYFVEV